jgi:hypothetical protein
VDYFLTTWNGTEITEQNLTYAWEKIRGHLKLYSPAERAWYDAARQNVQLANDLANYVGSTSGRPGQLVKDGSDLHFENLLTLFKEINGRGELATLQTITAAQDRIQHQSGKGRLHFVPQPRKAMGTISEAARNAGADSENWHAGESFLGSDLVPDGRGGLRSKTHAEQKRDREAEEEAAAAKTSAQQRLSEDEARWKVMCEEACRFGSHGQQEAIRQVFNQTSGSWRQRFEAVNLVVNMYKRSAAISGNFR